MARFDETVNIRPVRTDLGFEQASNSLLNRLESFSSSVKRNIAVGEAKEQKAQAVQSAKDKKQLEASRKYKKGLETAYLASLGNETKEGIKAIEAENPNNIISFNEKVSGFVSGIIKTVDPAVRDQALSFIDGQVSNSRIRVHSNTIRKNKADAAAESFAAVTSFGNEAAILAREGNVIGSAESIAQSFTVIEGMVESGDMKADRAATLKREIEREASEQGLRLKFDGLAETEGLEKSFEELEAISNTPAKGWTPDEWDSFVSSQQADLRQKAVRQQQLKAKSDIETVREVSNLKIKSKTGVDLDGNPVDASVIIGETDKLFNSGAISGNERSSIISTQIERMKVDTNNALSKQKVAARVGGANEIALTQTDVDLTWDEEIEPQINNLPPEMQGAAIAQFVDSTKIVPSKVTDQVNNNLNSDDVELVSQSADLMDRLDSVRGIPDNNFSPSDRAYAETVVGLQKNMDPQEAIKLARQNTNPNDSGRIDSRKGIIKDGKLELEYPDIVNNAFDPFFGEAVVDDISRGQLTQEYKVLFEQHFIAGMSKDNAEKKALQLIERNWSEDQATNKMLKYPTQDYYAVNGSVDYIRKDLFTSVADASVGLPEFTTEDILLISDGTTARQASQGRPSYLVAINAGEQGIVPLMKFRYIPDMQAQIIKEQKANEKLVAEGRRKSTTFERDVLKSFDRLRSF